MLQKTKHTYVLFTKRNYTIDDHVMDDIIFHTVLDLFIDIIIPLFNNKLYILNKKFILPITGDINIMDFIRSQPQRDMINHYYGEDVYEEYGWNEYIKYIKEELTEYFEYNTQPSILK